MIINNAFLAEIVGLKVDRKFECQTLGLVNSNKKGTLSFLDDEGFVNELINNPNIIAVITTRQLAKLIKGKTILYSKDPRYDFYSLYNIYAQANYKKKPSVIDETADVHPSAFISEFNVTIGENCIIEPNATILPDVIIGNNSIIRAGAVIGSEGFEHKSTTKGILSVKHLGNVVIEKNVEVGANSCIDKAVWDSTIVKEGTKIDNLCHISHNVSIGKNCIITAGVVIAGSCTIGESVWFGVSSCIHPQIIIGDNAFIGMGSVVVRNINQGVKVLGNPAAKLPV